MAVGGARGRRERPVQPAQSRHRRRRRIPSGPLFNADLVQTGPVLRKGYISQVTAGPKTGFGLMTQRRRNRVLQQAAIHQRHAGLGFPEPDRVRPAGPASRQALPVQCDDLRLGRAHHHDRAAPSGLQICALVHSLDRRCDHLGADVWNKTSAVRSPASIGMDQERINQKVYEGSIGRFRQEIPQEALEEAQERIGGETVQRNADLRSAGLLGDGTLAVE